VKVSTVACSGEFNSIFHHWILSMQISISKSDKKIWVAVWAGHLIHTNLNWGPRIKTAGYMQVIVS
jgi:hypothetical protein